MLGCYRNLVGVLRTPPAIFCAPKSAEARRADRFAKQNLERNPGSLNADALAFCAACRIGFIEGHGPCENIDGGYFGTGSNEALSKGKHAGQHGCGLKGVAHDLQSALTLNDSRLKTTFAVGRGREVHHGANSLKLVECGGGVDRSGVVVVGYAATLAVRVPIFRDWCSILLLANHIPVAGLQCVVGVALAC